MRDSLHFGLTIAGLSIACVSVFSANLYPLFALRTVLGWLMRRLLCLGAFVVRGQH